MSDAEKLSIEEANQQLSQLRSGRGGRQSSMYAPLLEEADALNSGEALSDTVDGYARVSGLRSYLDRHRPEQFVVKASKAEGEENKDQQEATYRVFVFRAEDVE